MKPSRFLLSIKQIITLTGMALLATTTLTAAAADVNASVLADIQKAQQTLSSTEKQISQQQQQLTTQYQALQQQVQQLREKTAVARRAEDESTLGLNQLTERLKGWQDQQQYQKNQLASFIRQHHLAVTDTNLNNQLQAASAYAAQLQHSLYPQWQSRDIIQPNGELINAKVLSAGPISWYWLAQQQQGGLLAHRSNDAEVPTVALPFSDNSALAQLQQQSRAELMFDPSLNKALLKSTQHESAVSHISKGGVWALPILAFALVALVIALHKAWQLWRLPPVQSASLPNARVQHSSGFAQQLASCSEKHAIGQQRDDALFAVLQHSRLTLDARLGAIAVTAAVAPLLGLLGTVSGMIETFNMMTLFGSGDPQVVSGGIAQALITTELGLVVAIPALVLHALLSRKARSYYHQLEALALSLSQQPLPQSAITQEHAA
ncbi:MotA/TolQ/ExbB proton channel family protein [Rheinheimera sp. D18]|uniref:MotA/TolQ/ExbB proton channel family protein n=1 Tax=Rheinheimera sp. D18 TaxID=2545632 RepID=UPI00104C3362|nr:MotA/TolQ/ExbB proton channel family protein [Rheinheimera sp. D18]QBL08170.1 MotA/TolQ/ExbB proton channel family protein [Rheinheimera sp. D18]